MDRLPASAACNASRTFAELNFGHHAQDVVLALEVVEEGSFAHISGLRDVFDGDILEAPLSKKSQGAAEQLQPGFSGLSFPAPHAFQMRKALRSQCLHQIGEFRAVG